jgi:hypothetical protein
MIDTQVLMRLGADSRILSMFGQFHVQTWFMRSLSPRCLCPQYDHRLYSKLARQDFEVELLDFFGRALPPSFCSTFMVQVDLEKCSRFYLLFSRPL